MDDADADIVRTAAGRGTDQSDVEAARARGEEAGADLSREGGENPYEHDVFELRTTWFDGFSAGRARNADDRGKDY